MRAEQPAARVGAALPFEHRERLLARGGQPLLGGAVPALVRRDGAEELREAAQGGAPCRAQARLR